MVPKKHADQLRESLASGEIIAVQSTLVADNTPLNSRVYTVRSGDTLSSIASRLGVSTKDLQQWNKLRGSKLKPGQSLTVWEQAVAHSDWQTTAIALRIVCAKAIRFQALLNATA